MSLLFFLKPLYSSAPVEVIAQPYTPGSNAINIRPIISPKKFDKVWKEVQQSLKTKEPQKQLAEAPKSVVTQKAKAISPKTISKLLSAKEVSPAIRFSLDAIPSKPINRGSQNAKILLALMMKRKLDG